MSKIQLMKHGGFLPFLILFLSSLGLGAATGILPWSSKNILDKISGRGIRQSFEGFGCKNM